jgi:hypothetical protein
MKYQHLIQQNESFRKQIDEQSRLIKSQTNLIDKLTTERLDLMSKLEVKTINELNTNTSFMLYNLRKG